MTEYIDERQFRESALDNSKPYANREMVIFKFDYVRHSAKKRVFSDSRLMTDFKIALINKFSPEDFESLVVYTFFQNAYHRLDPIKYPTERKVYEKSWLFDQYEIGLDIHKNLV